MSYESKVSSKGQVTIPKAVRERMGLEEGETVLFRFDEDGVRLVRVPADPRDRLDAARECAVSSDADAAALLDREREQWS